ncbi:MAG TPA: hypothetical protein VLM89_14955 [Phycisphaerae bacterium]|nr:hypothetical protein [Phycisphaerae bacterium]
MTFLFHDDPRFIAGLRRHGLLRDYGYRIHNTGLDRRPFGERWIDSPLLAEARRSGRPFYIDRIAGGMPFQSLKGIEQVAAGVKDDSRFLGFQLHEWGNSPIHDYQRVGELLLKKGLPFSREHFAEYEGRTESPFFGGGDFDIYETVYRPLHTQKDAEEYHAAYFRRMSELTAGHLMAVNGYFQLYHTALKLGARNVMAEIGNQVPLTALQIACVRGAARQHGKEFGVYYEPWGGAPFGCPCAVGWSPWFPGGGNPDNKVMGYKIRPELGSSRSLQRRLLYYAWLSGARWCAEEWGVENYFSNWDDYPLTEYGRVVQEFIELTSKFGPAVPIVPAAIVLPRNTPMIDLRYVGGYSDQLYEMFPADEFHVRMRHFALRVLGARPHRNGFDDFNLTPSPWIGSFDVLSADAPADLLRRYDLLVYFSKGRPAPPARPEQRILTYTGTDDDARTCVEALRQPAGDVEGEVGCARAHIAGRGIMIGLFNNLGVSKRDGKETTDPEATRTATVRGLPPNVDLPLGEQFATRRDRDSIEIAIPAGEIVLLLIPGDQQMR